MFQVTYRVIQVSDSQLEAQTDGAAVSLVTGFPAAGQTVTQVEYRRPTASRHDRSEEARLGLRLGLRPGV